MRVEAFGSPIQIKEVVDFYHRVYDIETHEVVFSKIRKVSEKVCDMSVILARVVQFFRRVEKINASEINNR